MRSKKKERKVRVLVDTFHLYNALTGIRTYTTQLCQGLETHDGLRAEYIIYPDWRKLNNSTFLKGRLSVFKKIVNHLSMFIWKQIILPITILRKRIDVVFCPDFIVPYLKFGAKGMPVIHDTFFWDFKENYPLLWRKYFLGMIELGLDKDAVIIATSNYTLKNIQRTINDKLPVEVIYQSPKLLSNSESNDHELEKFGIENAKYYLHVGVFDRRKNIQLLVQAFAKMVEKSSADYKLILVGEKGLGRNHNDFNIVSKLIQQLGLQEKVILTGFVSNLELGALYKHAFAYVFPSLDEGFGIPVLEALNFKIPLIISDRGSLKEIAGGAALQFVGNNLEDLVDKMLEIQKADVRDNLVSLGLQRVIEFNNFKFANQLDNVVMKYQKQGQ